MVPPKCLVSFLFLPTALSVLLGLITKATVRSKIAGCLEVMQAYMLADRENEAPQRCQTDPEVP